MFEYRLINAHNHTEELVIWGYSYKDACKRYGCNPTDWTVIRVDYVD